MVKERRLRIKHPILHDTAVRAITDRKAIREDFLNPPATSGKATVGGRLHREESVFQGLPDSNLADSDPAEILWYARTRPNTMDVGDIAPSEFHAYEEIASPHVTEFARGVLHIESPPDELDAKRALLTAYSIGRDTDVVTCVKRVGYSPCTKMPKKKATMILVWGRTRYRDSSLEEETKRLPGPIQFVSKLLKAWNLDTEVAVQLLGLQHSDNTYLERLLDGTSTLDRDEVKERIVYLFRVRKTLSALFRDVEVENSWLRESHRTLNGRVPMDLILDGSDRSLRLVVEYVEAAAGR